MAWSIDERLAPFILVSEVAEGEFFAGDLFRRKYGVTIPRMGRHLIAFYRQDEGTFLSASYLHMWTQGTIGLIGGACTDGRVLRAMQPRELELVSESGGLNLQMLRCAFARLDAGLEAFFGHCGDARAKEIVYEAGFSDTGLPNLIVHYPRTLTPSRRQELVQQAHAIGPF